MKLTLSWLKDHLDTEADLDTVVQTLTAIGLEVEGVENAAAKLKPFRIAEVISAAPHPQADKLQVLTVDDGSGEAIQVVCGASNARAGLKGVFGAPGAYVPGSDLTLKVAAIRGVESRGMMCSIRELQLGDEHEGIIELPADAPVGANYAQWAGLDDPVIDVSITPNRQDAMGVRGIARDLAAAGIGTLKPLIVEPIEGPAPSPEVLLEDPEGCPAYYAQNVDGVRNGPAPAWMQQRLRAIGQKPISALVDITNYIMFDLGRPLHVFDRAKIQGVQHVRRAADGEQFLALNGKTYTLDGSMTVIADDRHTHDLGGIMGGEGTGVELDTSDVLIECAFFDPERTALTGQKLGLTSDARQRFERGVDPAFLDDGIAVCARMIVELCGGTPSPVTRAGTPPVEQWILAYDPTRAESLGGLAVAPDRQAEILEKLGFSVDRGASAWQVSVPSWRRDVIGSADLVEEVLRIEGLDKLPSTPLPRAPGVARPTATAEQLIERKARRAAAARGLNEAVTWSFISEAEAAPFGGSAWVLANPISEDMKVMRPSLLPGLLSAARRNLARGAETVRLFELGRRYLGDSEHATIGIVLAGEKPRHWRALGKRAFDAFDVKAEAVAILAEAGAPVGNLQVLGDAAAIYHPGQSGRLGLGPKTILAEFGALHPRVLKAFNLDGQVVAAELYLDAIPAKRASGHMRPAYAPPALQPVRRDFAFLVPESLPAGDLLRAVRGADKAAIDSVSLFDLFTGPGVPEGQKSLAIEVVLQPTEKSFTDEELKAISERVVAAAAKVGAVLRA